ncbi:MAG TPA: histidine phosphatase family protein [Candidatus Nanoarchaeia archaeon]|nr:histidine phosphatase family protein [Candidatus Nanoarchaeia archaeon]
MFDRAKTFLTSVVQQHKNHTAVFVGHNGINKAIISILSGNGSEHIGKLSDMKNGEIMRFDVR